LIEEQELSRTREPAGGKPNKVREGVDEHDAVETCGSDTPRSIHALSMVSFIAAPKYDVGAEVIANRTTADRKQQPNRPRILSERNAFVLRPYW
jgi:hypothetical protein